MNKGMMIVSAACLTPLPVIADHVGLQVESGPGSAIITIGAETLRDSQQVLAAQYQYLKLDTLSDHTLLDTEGGVHSVKEFTQASMAYSFGVTDRLTFSAVLPFVSRNDFREALNHHKEESDVEHHDDFLEDDHNETELDGLGGDVLASDLSGWGDLTFLGRYALNSGKPDHRYALLAGIKVPTGATDKKLDNGEKAELEHQPGTGSWDALLGFAYSTEVTPTWSFSSNILYQLTTEGRVLSNVK